MYTIHNGDCLDVLRTTPNHSVDSIVTDPPYGLRFMGKRWDHDVPSVGVWEECLRVLKPGGHLLAFAGTRTQHRMACRIEDAGFEMTAAVRQRRCPRCDRMTANADCCGIDLTTRRRRFRMTPQLVRMVHIVARHRKGLDEDTYRLRLRAVGVASCKDFDRAGFTGFMAALAKLPDAPRKARG